MSTREAQAHSPLLVVAIVVVVAVGFENRGIGNDDDYDDAMAGRDRR